MRINHLLANRLSKKLTVKTRLFNALEIKYGKNTKIKYTDIIRTLVEDVKGWKYSHKSYRGYFACALSGRSSYKDPTPYLLIPGRDGRYLEKISRGHWELTGTKL
jgi:hypothetical protein